MPISKASSNAVAPAAKGDLVVGTTTNDSGILSVGNNGETLVADSSTATGLKWAAPSAGGINPNAVINGGFDIWQRGTSFTALSKTFTADRWWKFRSGDTPGGTWSRQNSAVSAPGTQYCMRIQRDSGNTSTAALKLFYDFETSNSIIYAGQQVTVSFYARKGANYSGGDFNLILVTGTGTDQSLYAGYTGGATALTVTATAASMNTSTFVRYSGTVTLASTVTQFGFEAAWSPSGTAGAADFVEITGIKLEDGSSATDFIRSGGTLAGELAACQRYYEKTYSIATAPGTDTYEGHQIISGSSDGGSQVYHTPRFQVRKRANPTITTYTNDGISGQWGYNRSGASGNITASVIRISDNGALIYGNVGATYVVTTWAGHWVANAEL